MKINSIFLSDSYKMAHPRMLPVGTTMVYGNCTPRSGKHAPKGITKVVHFGSQLLVRWLKEDFDDNFFNNKNAVKEIQEELTLHYGTDYDASHFQNLHDLGYLPLKFKSLPEGVEVPFGVPVMTWYNTHPDFAWLSLCLETPLSTMYWKMPTSATIALAYKRLLTEHALKTDKSNVDFVNYQAHDFSARGLAGIDATWLSGLGHLTSFLGSDTLACIPAARHYYDETELVSVSVPASEHSVSSACISTMGELEMLRYYMAQFPKGVLSIVSDTFDLWKVITEYLPELKEEILARDGKLVIRPDSGDPVDIICGKKIDFEVSEEKLGKNLHLYLSNIADSWEDGEVTWGQEAFVIAKCEIAKCYTFSDIDDDTVGDEIIERESIGKINGQYYTVKEVYQWGGVATSQPKLVNEPEAKGVIEILWDTFGGTINEQGYKVLDPHIGAIYGDSITLERADEICKRLEAKGFASTNIVLGIGSFTYQYNTRDTFGFAMKATYVELINSDITKDDEVYRTNFKPKTIGREIFKDPITDDGTKKSAKGLLTVDLNEQMGLPKYELIDQVSWKDESQGCLQTIFENGKFSNQTTLTEIREKLNG